MDNDDPKDLLPFDYLPADVVDCPGGRARGARAGVRPVRGPNAGDEKDQLEAKQNSRHGGVVFENVSTFHVLGSKWVRVD